MDPGHWLCLIIITIGVAGLVVTLGPVVWEAFKDKLREWLDD